MNSNLLFCYLCIGLFQVLLVCDESVATDWSLLDEATISTENKELLAVIKNYENQTRDLVQVRLNYKKKKLGSVLLGFFLFL